MAPCSECSDRGTARGSHPIAPSRQLQYETPNETFPWESDFHRRTLRRQPAMGFSHSKYAITAASPGVREASVNLPTFRTPPSQTRHVPYYEVYIEAYQASREQEKKEVSAYKVDVVESAKESHVGTNLEDVGKGSWKNY